MIINDQYRKVDKGNGGAYVDFLIALLILILIVLIGYGLLYYLGRKQTKTNMELDERKQEIMAIPVSDKLYTLKNKDVSGKTRRSFETEQANWQTITRYKLPEIEAALVSAQADAEKYSLIKARQTANKVESLLDETEDTVSSINQRLEDILASEKANEEAYSTTYDRYAAIRKQLLAHSYNYGSSVEILEKNLSYIELDFTKFNQTMNDGDFLEAKEILVQVNEDIDELEVMMDEIPDLQHTISEEYVEQLEDMQAGYEQMLDEQFVFPNDMDIPAEIEKSEKFVKQSKQAVTDVDLSEAKTLMNKAEVQIDKTYSLMEQEIYARDYIGKHQGALQRKVDKIMESNRYGILEVDRVSQSYLLYENEMGKMQEYTDQIEREKNLLDDTNQAIAEHQIAYSDMESRYKAIDSRLDTIEKGQTQIVISLSDLKQRERDAKDDLDVYELDLRNIKRSVEKYHLPGLPDEYLDRFFYTEDMVLDLSKKLNRVRLDINDIEKISQQIAEDIDQLDKEADAFIDYAILTEDAIQYANRYRPDHPEIERTIGQASELFHRDFQYEEAFNCITDEIEKFEPGARERIIQFYQEAKANNQI